MRNPGPAAIFPIVALAIAIGPVGAQVRVEPPGGQGASGNHGVVIWDPPPPTFNPTLSPTLTPILTPTVTPGPGNPTVSSGGGGAQVPPGVDGTGLSGDDGLFRALADAVNREQVIEGVPLVKKRRLLLVDE